MKSILTNPLYHDRNIMDFAVLKLFTDLLKVDLKDGVFKKENGKHADNKKRAKR